MSGTRYTEDLHSIKTRQFTLQNPDGSFPTLGVVLGIVDDIGTVQPVADISINTLTAAQINITGTINQNILSSTTIAANNVSAGTVTTTNTLAVNDLSAARIYAPTSTSQSLTADSCYAPLVSNLLIPNSNLDTIEISQLNYGSIANLDILEVSKTLTTPNLSAVVASFSDISANRVTNQAHSASIFNAYDISASRAVFTSDLSAQSLYVSGQLVGPALTTTTLNSNSAEINGLLDTKYIDISGTFSFSSSNAVFAANTKVDHVIARSINTKSLNASSGIFTDISAGTFNISALNSNANITSLVSPNTVVVANSATAFTTTTGPLTVTGSASILDISMGSATTDTMITAAMRSTNTLTTSVVTPGLNIGGAPLVYNTTTGLTINGVAASNISRIAPVLFHETLPINNLERIADISATLSNSVDTYNSLLGIFATLGIMVTTVSDNTPSITFNSPASMQFLINGVPTVPVTFNSGSSYTLQQISTALNAVCSPTLRFVPQNVDGLWNVAINVTGSAAIADVSSTPTGSLQLLRFFGFSILDTSNIFETYAVSPSGTYTMTSYILNTSIISWRDKSDSRYVADIVESAITTVPYNGLNVMNFGLNRMRINSFAWNSAFTTAMVFKSSAAKFLISQVIVANAYQNYVFSGNSSLTYVTSDPVKFIATDPNYTSGENPAPVVPADTWVILILGYNNGISLSHYSVNGVSRTSTAEGQVFSETTNQQYYINGNGSNAFDTSQVAEIVHYNTSITGSERVQLETYLSNKWSIPVQNTTTLPSSWIPTTIANCTLWLDAADPATYSKQPTEPYRAAVTNNLTTVPNITFSTVDCYTVNFTLQNGSSSGATYLSLYSAATGYLLFDIFSSLKTVTGLPPNTSTVVTATFLNDFNRSSPYTMLWITPPIPSPPTFTARTVGVNTITVGWTRPVFGNSYRLDFNNNSIILGPTTYAQTYNNLLPNTTYNFILYSIDVRYNSLSAPITLQITTPRFIVDLPSVTYQYNNVLNISPGSIISGTNLSGTLRYRINGGNPVVVPGLGTSFSQLVNITGKGTIDCSLNYTDGVSSATSGLRTFAYDTSFGFYNLTASSNLTISSSNWCGYSFVNFNLLNGPGEGPFVGNRFNRIAISTTGGSGSIQAIVCQIQYSPSYSIWYSQWSANILPVIIDTSSNIISVTSPSSITLTFATPVTINQQTTVLFRCTGAGTIQIPAFNQRINNPPQETIATAVTYSSAPLPVNIKNAFANTGLGCICQFSLI